MRARRRRRAHATIAADDDSARRTTVPGAAAAALDGRPAPVKVRPRPPAPGRLAAHRRVERTRRLALPFRLLFVVAVVASARASCSPRPAASGKVADAIGATFTGFVADLTATPVPSERRRRAGPTRRSSRSPTSPTRTSRRSTSSGRSRRTLVGANGNRHPDLRRDRRPASPGIVTEVPVGGRARFIVPEVTLIEGTNAFTATIVGPTGESEPSPVVTYVFDATKPRIVAQRRRRTAPSSMPSGPARRARPSRGARCGSATRRRTRR